MLKKYKKNTLEFQTYRKYDRFGPFEEEVTVKFAFILVSWEGKENIDIVKK